MKNKIIIFTVLFMVSLFSSLSPLVFADNFTVGGRTKLEGDGFFSNWCLFIYF